MSDKPILFSAPMVRAILAGTKTQTRRVVKPWWLGDRISDDFVKGRFDEYDDDGICMVRENVCPYGQPGNRLWVKETFRRVFDTPAIYEYRADSDVPHPLAAKWKPSIFCTRAASRIALEITAVRVERLNDITEADALAEGVPAANTQVLESDGLKPLVIPARRNYQSLWTRLNGPGSWESNPWVWVITFKRISQIAVLIKRVS